MSAIILNHHRLRAVKGDAVVEAFRRADLCDLTFGEACEASATPPGLNSTTCSRSRASTDASCGSEERTHSATR